MELGWGALVLILAVAAIVWFLQDSLAVRERANAAAMEACNRLSLQFLDGTVAFARLAFTREHGQLTFRRTYVFDYTANSIERRQGFVILVGRHIESVGYAPGEEQRSRPQPQPITPSLTVTMSVTIPPANPEPEPEQEPRPVASAEVFDLADWRARRRGMEQQPPSPRRIGTPEPGNGHVDG